MPARLIEGRADINKCDGQERLPLFLASAWGHTAAVELLLQARADINGQCPKPGPGWAACKALTWAAMTGQLAVTKVLLRARAKVNAKGSDGLTAMEVARRDGNPNVADFIAKLLDKAAQRKMQKKKEF